MKIVKRKLTQFVLSAVMAFVLSAGVATGANAAESDSSTDKQVISDLIANKEFEASDSKISMSYDQKADGVFIKGKTENVNAATYTFNKEFDFGKDQVSRLVIDGLAEKKKKAVISFYLDDEKEAFAKVKLNNQKRDDVWVFSKNKCVELTDKHITGKHKLSFKIDAEGGKKKVKFLLRYVFFMKSDIPTVNFDLDETQGSISEMNGDSEHNTECYGNVTIEVPDGYKSEYSDAKFETATYPLDYVRGRGNSTWSAEKKPYKFKLEKAADLFGMGSNKHWVLLANYYDASLLRNKMTYWLGNVLGMEYTPQCIFADVVMNGQYLGSYYLCEQIRVGESRVAIDDLEKDDEAKKAIDAPFITGGYLMGMNPYTYNDALNAQFTTEQGNTFELESPAFKDYSNETQLKYITDYMQKTENAIYGPDFKDEDGVSYTEYMDIDAAAMYYLIQEISSNGDAFGSSSTYLYKKRNGKLFWGPLWDFDYVAWGNVDLATDGFSCNSRTWFAKLLQDKKFYDKVVEKWSVIREKLLEAAKDGGQLDIYAKELENSQKANYNVWKTYNDRFFDDVVDDVDANDSAAQEVTFASEVTRLKQWVNDRVAWFDDNIQHIEPKTHTVTFMVDDTVCAQMQVADRGYDNYIAMPETPVKDGYVFSGWYKKTEIAGKEYEVKVTELQSVTSDVTVYAKWIRADKIKPLQKLVFEKDEFYQYINDDMMLRVYALPFNAVVSDLTLESSDEKIATISMSEDGTPVILTHERGDVKITATDNATGVKADCIIHVRDYDEMSRVESFALDEKNVTITKGDYYRIKPVSIPDNYPYISYRYIVVDEKVAQVNEAGYVYAKKAGTTYVGVLSENTDLVKFVKVTVKDKKPKAGEKFTYNGLGYKVVKCGTKNTVVCTGFAKSAKAEVKVQDTVSYKGIKFNVTEIAKNAFKGNKKLKKVTIGKNVTKIGEKAFYNCKNLKTVKIQSGKDVKIGKNAFQKTKVIITTKISNKKK